MNQFMIQFPCIQWPNGEHKAKQADGQIVSAKRMLFYQIYLMSLSVVHTRFAVYGPTNNRSSIVYAINTQKVSIPSQGNALKHDSVGVAVAFSLGFRHVNHRIAIGNVADMLKGFA